MKKIIQILTICIILAAVIIIPIKGFNVGLPYVANTQINVSLDNEFNIADIKAITKEVFNRECIIQKVEVYEEMAQITVRNATEEEIENLINKINEKYQLTLSRENLIVTENANTRLRVVAKPYVVPMFISLAIILIYIVIRFYKLDTWKILYKASLIMVLPQLLIFCLYAITRVPVNVYTPVVFVAAYIASAVFAMAFVQKKEKEISKTEKEEK